VGEAGAHDRPGRHRGAAAAARRRAGRGADRLILRLPVELPAVRTIPTQHNRRSAAAEGTLAAASVETGIAQRDEHLRGPKFFDADRHPYIGLRALRFEPAEGGWVVPAMLTVGAVETAVTLHGRRLPDPAAGAVAVRITGEFDRTSTRMRAPRLLVGHRIAMQADLTFTRR
jgi:polyisoprenoid-binding protein YceI